MFTDVDPLIVTDHSDPAAGFKPIPTRSRREERSAAQLTDAAATALITGGRLTPRDLTVLRAVWMYGVMSADQVTRLVFYPLTGSNATNVANRRLAFLYQEYCLNRAWRGYGQDFVYTLEGQGVRLIQMEQQKDSPAEIHWSPLTVGRQLLRLDHYLAITEFGVQLSHAARTWPGGGELRWYGEHTLTLPPAAGDRLTPAGLGLLRLEQTGLAFFLEWDRGVDPVAVVADQVNTYVTYLRTPAAWQGQFTRFPTVLIAMASPTRAADLGVAVRERLKTWLADNEKLNVLVTAQDKLREQGIWGPVWLPAGGGGEAVPAGEQGVSLPQWLKSPAK